MAESISKLEEYKGKNLRVCCISGQVYGEIKSVTKYGIIIYAPTISDKTERISTVEEPLLQFIPWTAIHRIVLS